MLHNGNCEDTIYSKNESIDYTCILMFVGQLVLVLVPTCFHVDWFEQWFSLYYSLLMAPCAAAKYAKLYRSDPHEHIDIKHTFTSSVELFFLLVYVIWEFSTLCHWLMRSPLSNSSAFFGFLGVSKVTVDTETVSLRRVFLYCLNRGTLQKCWHLWKKWYKIINEVGT